MSNAVVFLLAAVVLSVLFSLVVMLFSRPRRANPKRAVVGDYTTRLRSFADTERPTTDYPGVRVITPEQREQGRSAPGA
jgi:hypothetical protein